MTHVMLKAAHSQLTAEEKISQAERILDKLFKFDLEHDEFNDQLSAFLSATQSIFYHLLAEYSSKFKLGLTGTEASKANKFRQAAKHNANNDAQSFIAWYDSEYQILLNQRFYGFLVNKRHNDIHIKTERPHFFAPIPQVYVTRDKDNNEKLNQPTMRFFDESIENFDTFDDLLDARIICKMYLMHVTVIVHKARKFQT